jgi:hypothetical protein
VYFYLLAKFLQERLLETSIRAGDGLEFFIRLARVFAIASSEGRG